MLELNQLLSLEDIDKCLYTALMSEKNSGQSKEKDQAQTDRVGAQITTAQATLGLTGFDIGRRRAHQRKEERRIGIIQEEMAFDFNPEQDT